MSGDAMTPETMTSDTPRSPVQANNRPEEADAEADADAAPRAEPAQRTPGFFQRWRDRRRHRSFIHFAPDAVELEHRPPPVLAHAVLFTLAAMLFSGITWASLAEIDEVVTAPGRVTTTASVLVVQPLETSIIRTVEVDEGDVVKKGEVLATLDPTFTDADVGQLRTQLASLEAQLARLQAEIDDAPFAVPDDGTHDMRVQAIIFDERHRHMTARLRAYDAEIKELQANLKSKEADSRVLASHHETLRELEGMRRTLAENQNGSRASMLEARANRLEVERDLELARNGITEITESIGATEAEREAFQRQWRQETVGELVEVQRKANEVREQLSKALRRSDLVHLRAPQDGVVLQVAQRSIGSVARQAEPLVSLVPVNTELEVEARVRAADVGHIAVGNPVRIKVMAYPFQKYGTLEGDVRTISRDSFNTGADGGQPQSSGESGGGGSQDAYYKIQVALTKTDLDRPPEGYHLLPGMTVTSEIKVGKRTVISYFLYPLIRGLDESIREP